MDFKVKYFCLLGFAMCFACDKSDKECTPPALKEHVVGTWSANFVSKPQKISVVEFSKDGVYTEKPNLLVGTYFSPVASWNVSGDTIYIIVKYTNSGTSKYQFVPSENTCDEMLLDMVGLDRVRLTRKQ